MNKSQFIKATYKQWNEIREVGDMTIALVCFHENCWKIVPRNTTFEECRDREYKPIAQFRTREELWEYIKD